MEWPRDLVMIISVQISSTATAQEEISNSYISELRISFSDHSVIIGLDANGMFTRLHVNTNDLSAFTKNYSTIRRSILPYILDKPGDEYIISAQGYFTAFTNAIVEELQKYLPRSVATYTIRAIAGGMMLPAEIFDSDQAHFV